MKKIKAVNLDDENYKKFLAKCIMNGTNVSNELDKYIKSQLEEDNVSDNNNNKEK